MVAIVIAGGLLPFIALAILKLVSTRPDNLGLQNGRLAACPDSPNCVSSQDDRASHSIEPLSFQGEAPDAWTRLRHTIGQLPNARVVEDSGTYMSVEFSSRFFGFVDDAEFSLEQNRSSVHVRSASRIGYSDLGVNRRRIESIRTAFAVD